MKLSHTQLVSNPRPRARGEINVQYIKNNRRGPPMIHWLSFECIQANGGFNGF